MHAHSFVAYLINPSLSLSPTLTRVTEKEVFLFLLLFSSFLCPPHLLMRCVLASHTNTHTHVHFFLSTPSFFLSFFLSFFFFLFPSFFNTSLSPPPYPSPPLPPYKRTRDRDRGHIPAAPLCPGRRACPSWTSSPLPWRSFSPRSPCVCPRVALAQPAAAVAAQAGVMRPERKKEEKKRDQTAKMTNDESEGEEPPLTNCRRADRRRRSIALSHRENVPTPTTAPLRERGSVLQKTPRYTALCDHSRRRCVCLVGHPCMSDFWQRPTADIRAADMEHTRAHTQGKSEAFPRVAAEIYSTAAYLRGLMGGAV